MKLLNEREFCHLGLDSVVFEPFQLRMSSGSVTPHEPGVAAQKEFLATL